MIFFISTTRLGNQLFQYAFLKTIQKNNEKIITWGFDHIKEIFDGYTMTNFRCNSRRFIPRKTRRHILPIIRAIFSFLIKRKLVNHVTVNGEAVLDTYWSESDSYTMTPGYFKNITIVSTGFFQSEKFFEEKKICQLKIKDQYVVQAAKILQKTPENCHKIFVHIRRGDYVKFKVFGKTTLLPLSYYKEQMSWFSDNVDNPYFIFLSDDVEFIKQNFKEYENCLISDSNHYGVDLSIISLCDSGIVSASSFSWWGSYFMKNRYKVFAPKYWFGFESAIESPKGVIANFMTPVIINPELEENPLK